MMGYCKWIYNDFLDAYDTECDNVHCFIEGDVKENKYKFCPYCGKEIEEKKLQRDGD